MDQETDEIPQSLEQKMNAFTESLVDVEDIYKPFLKIPITDIRDKIGDPLQKAKLDLMVAYTTNSLFWTYLITQGVDPKTHPIKDELLRIKEYIGKLQQLEDKKKMARLDTHAAKRFIRSALWEPPASKKSDSPAENNPEEEQSNEEEISDEKYNEEEVERDIEEQVVEEVQSKKRKRENRENNKVKKKKKKKSKPN